MKLYFVMLLGINFNHKIIKAAILKNPNAMVPWLRDSKLRGMAINPMGTQDDIGRKKADKNLACFLHELNAESGYFREVFVSVPSCEDKYQKARESKTSPGCLGLIL